MADQEIAPVENAGAQEGPFPLSTLRHSVAHLMASAVQNLHPGVRFGFGPSIEHGFYYDFDLEEPLTDKDLARIEKEMRRIAKKSPEIRCEVKTREEAIALLARFRGPALRNGKGDASRGRCACLSQVQHAAGVVVGNDPMKLSQDPQVRIAHPTHGVRLRVCWV